MNGARWILGTLLAAAVLPASATGQPVILVERTSGFLRLEYDGYATTRSDGIGSGRQGFHERLQARLRAAVYDPDFVEFDLGVEPYGRQSAHSSDRTEDNAGRTAGLNGFLSMRFLSERALSATLMGSRSDARYNDTYGTETETGNTRFGATLRYRNVLLPLTLEYESLSSTVDWWRGGQEVDGRDFTTRKLSFSGENSKTQVHLQRLDYEDILLEYSIGETTGWLNHRFQWGKGSALTSMLLHSEQTRNGAPVRTTRWTQSSHLQHTLRVGSDFTYGLARGQVLGLGSRGFNGSASTMIRLTRELEAGWLGSFTWLNQGPAGTAHSRLGAQAAYRREYTGGLAFSLGVAGGGEWRRRRLPAEGGFHVVDEVYLVPESGVFRLRQPHVDSWTIRITSADGTDRFRVHHDYLIVDQDPFVEIHDLTRGRIESGDSVAISYSYRLAEGFDARYANLTADLSMGGLSLFHRRYLRGGERQQLDGGVFSLAEMDEMSTGLAYAAAGSWGSAQGMIQHRRLRSDYGNFEGVTGRGRYRFEIGPRVGGSVGGSASRTEGDNRTTSSWGLGAGALFRARQQLTFNGSLSYARWRSEAFSGANLATGVATTWTYGSTVTQARYDHYWWENPVQPGSPESALGQHRVLVTMTRTF